jgi:hypothetical protein
MRRVWHWLCLALVLVITGLAIAAYKVNSLGYPLQAGAADESWTVQVRIQLEVEQGPVRVDLRLPRHTPGLARLREDFISPQFGVALQDDGWSRSATWTVRRSRGPQTLYYRATFYRQSSSEQQPPAPAFPPRPLLEEPFQTAMLSVVEQVRAHSADVESFAAEMLARINGPAPSSEVALFLNDPDWRENPVRIARILLADARIPTQQINGLMLSATETRATPTRLLAVHNGDVWIYMDPATGRRGLPESFLYWWAGEEPVLQVSGARLNDIQWSIRRNEIDALMLAEHRAAAAASGLAWFSLLDLPVDTQAVYAVLLLVPVGAFVIVLMRNVVGVRSFGTFMPVLIALAFRETGLIGGLALFTLVVAFGLTGRFYLERLRLLLVPRLTAVLIIVVMLMVGLTLLSNRMGIEIGLSVGLFPMVILAMVIERMSIIWEERGPQQALLEGFGSALIAALAYLVMTLPEVEYTVFVFPELLLVMLGLTILMGRYTGYRISEALRFRELVR